MSCYEWEAGTIVLPTAQFAAVKNGVLAAAKTHWNSAFEHTQKCWKAMPAKAKKDGKLYNKWVNAYVYGNQPGTWNYDEKLPRMQPIERSRCDRNSLTEDVHDLLSTACPWVGGTQGTPRRVLKTDLPTLNNKTTRFYAGEASINFDRDHHSVHWEVPENNHARDYCRDHPIARALFARLDRLNWTRGSGGVIVANDEYNRDSENPGGGGNYIVSSYGPRGKQHLERQSRAWR